MRKIYIFLFAGIILPAAIFAQATDKPAEKTGISPELRDKAVKFLRATSNDVAALRTPENRLGLNAELANLMWFHDEKESRQMFGSVIADFRQLLAQLDSQITAMSVTASDVGENMPFFGGSNSQKAQFSRKFYKAVGVRSQIAQSLAERDAVLAYEFFDSTAQAISNPELRKLLVAQDPYIEAKILQKVAEQDPDKTLSLARKTLAKGFNGETLEILKKLYEKSPEKGAEFGADVIAKVKSEPVKPETFYLLNAVLQLGVNNLNEIKDKSGTKPIFPESGLRDLAGVLAQEILKLGEEAVNYDVGAFVENIAKFQPDRAAAMRRKFLGNEDKPIPSGSPQGEIEISAPSPEVAPTPDAKDKLEENIKNLENKQLPEEERKAIIAEARRIIGQNLERGEKLSALGVLAMQVAAGGDKELAAEILSDTETLVNRQPKSYKDFLEIWMLVGGYAQTDANRAFPMLEDTIYRLNDTIAAFIKVGEFMDVSGDMIEDGEVQISSFGGEMTRGLLGGLDGADETILALADADFERTAGLTDKFSQPEVRVLARMLILRSILGKIAPPSEVEKKADAS